MALNRLLSNLPFNPSLIGQVSFYAKRLHREESIRRIGLVMTILAMIVQLFAVMAPAKPTLASANENDIIYGGGDAQSFLQAYRNNSDGLGRRDIRAIFEHYLGSAGAVETALANGVQEEIISDAANNFWSIGRTQRDSGDIPLGIPGAQTGIYQRTLRGWGDGRVWRAIRVKSAVNSQDMWILNDCGNIVTRGPFQHDSPSPHLNKTADPQPGSHVRPGQKITYNLLFGNTGPGNMIGTVIYDRVPPHTSLIPQSHGGFGLASDVYQDSDPGNIVRWWPSGNPDKVWGVDSNNWQAWFSVTVNANVPEGTQICNTDARLSWVDNGTAHNKWLGYPVCHTVVYERCQDGTLKTPEAPCMISCPDGSQVMEGQQHTCPKPVCPYNSGLSTDSPECKVVVQSLRCEYFNEITPAPGRNERRFAVKPQSVNGAEIADYGFDYNNDDQIDLYIPANSNEEVSFTYTYPENGGYYRSQIIVRHRIDGAVVASDETCLLEIDIPLPPSTPEQALLTISKRVRNLTQALEDAHDTTASPGDELEYWLITKNVGTAAQPDHQLASEDLSDVLEYADIINLGDGVLNTDSKVVTWPPATIEKNEEIIKKIVVKVKDPLPVTPVSRATPRSFDLVMQNHYGNDVAVKLEKPLPKQIENAGQTLPKTGPGTSIVLIFMIATMTAYFFMRSRILAKELDYVRVEYSQNGGF